MNTTPVDRVNNSEVSEEERLQYLQELQDETTVTMIPAMTFLIILGVTGLVGNSTVLFVYTRKFRTNSTRVLIRAIAVFDLVANVCAIPGEIYDMFHIWDFNNPGLCRARLFISAFATLSTGLALLVVAVVRYRKVCKPYLWQVTVTQAKFICVAVACLGGLFSIPYAIINGRQTKETPRSDILAFECTADDSYKDTVWPVINNGFFLLLFLLCCVPLTVLYVQIGLMARKHGKQHGIHAADTLEPKAACYSNVARPDLQKTEDKLVSTDFKMQTESQRPSEESARNEGPSDPQMIREMGCLDTDVSYRKEVKPDSSPGFPDHSKYTTENHQPDKTSSTAKTVAEVNRNNVREGSLGSCYLTDDIVLLKQNDHTLKISPIQTFSNGCYQSYGEENEMGDEKRKANTSRIESKMDKHESLRTEKENVNFTEVKGSNPLSAFSTAVSRSQLEDDDIREYRRRCREFCKAWRGYEVPGIFLQGVKVLSLSSPSPKENIEMKYNSQKAKGNADVSDISKDKFPKAFATLPNRNSNADSQNIKFFTTDASIQSTIQQTEPTHDRSESMKERDNMGVTDCINETDNSICNVLQCDKTTENSFYTQKNSRVTNAFRRIKSLINKEAITTKSIYEKNIDARRSLSRMTAMLITISAVYIIGFLPYIALSFFEFIARKEYKSLNMAELSVYNLFLRFYFLNCAANPIIYSLCDVNFRKECFKIMGLRSRT